VLGTGIVALGLLWALGWLGTGDAERSPSSVSAITPPGTTSPPISSGASPSAVPSAATAGNPAEAAPSPKPALLANERAEADRFAALKEKAEQAPPKSQAEPKLFYRVEVRDGGTLVAGEVVIKLAGVVPRAAGATCKDARGETWPCGAEARTALARLIRSRAVTCLQPPGDKKSFAARCKVGATDLSAWMVQQGWTEAAQPADPALAQAAEAARQNHLGIWRATE
jgi:endonuclease YncB( thermonuclease family)